MARVFIGIPTLNRPVMVCETINSVLAQGYSDWQAVVSDNVSKGNASDQVAAFVAELCDPRLSFFQQPSNEGEYGQGRFFFEQARSLGADFLVILHDDDVLEPDYLQRATTALDAHQDATFFVCNPSIIDDAGMVNPANTQAFDERWGRKDVQEGHIDVLNTHMRHGFTPISGAFFRLSALIESGFVDPDLTGCFPFESNIFLRLGERGMRAWFTPDRLFRLRWHNQQMTNWGFLNDTGIVDATIRLFERRRFNGDNERLRRRLLGRLHRVQALHRARDGDRISARKAALKALRSNPASIKSWLIGSATIIAPTIVGILVRKHFVPRTYSSI